MHRIKGISCSIFKEEIKHLQATGKCDIPFDFIDSRNHVFPDNLGKELNKKLLQNVNTLLVFGDCYSNMSDLEDLPYIKRVKGMNCVEILLGSKKYKKLRKQNVFFMLPEWTKRWEEVFKNWLGLNKENAQNFMQDMHSKIIYVDTGIIAIPYDKLDEISQYCGLKYEIMQAELTHLELVIKDKIAEFSKDVNYNAARTRAYDFLVVDLIEKVMNYQSSQDCGRIIAESIRELLGVKCVTVFEKLKDGFNLVSFEPARRLKNYDTEDLATLASELHKKENNLIFQRVNSPEKVSDFLHKYEIDKVGLIPLESNNNRIGSIILIDIYDDRNIQIVVESLTKISTIIALVLQNSNLISNLEQTIEERTHELQISKERLKTAASILRHDITNDLAVIDSALAIYQEENIPEMLDEIKKRVDKSVATIRLQREHELFLDSFTSLDEFDLSETIRKSAAEYSDIKINITGNSKVYADNALYSVFGNLISNAIRHGQTDHIDIKMECDENYCTVKFIDYGVGIPDDLKYKVFKKGFKYGKTGHTGIGLYIVKETIEDYDGEVYIEDTPHHGATFVIKLKKVIE